METAFDNNSENNVCEIETSHFKTFDTNHEYTSSDVAKDTFLEDEHKATSPIELLKSNITPDFSSDQTTSNLSEAKHRFEDDFGPETDVDAVDDANISKTPNMLLEDDAFSSNVTNGVKGFSLENKIIEHLSGQHKEFLTNTNPFSDDQFDQYHDQYAMKDEPLDQTAIEKSENDSELVVDNKIIDALESLGITNGEKQTHDDEDKPLDSGLVNDLSAEVAGYTEKADQSYEKSFTETHSEPEFDHNASVICDKQDMEEQTYGVNPNCAATSAGEDSDEEDEWNYIQGDKKQDQPLEQTEALAPSVDAPVEDGSFHQDPVGSEFVVEEDEIIAELPTSETPSDAFVADGEPSETIDEPREPEADLCSTEEALLDPISVDAASPLIPAEQDIERQEEEQHELEHQELEEEHQEEEHQETEQIESNEYVPSPVPRSVVQSEVQEEIVSQPDVVTLEQETESHELDAEVLLVDQREEAVHSEDSELADDHELERPNSLSFDMASKLNPEAKEFVPTGSPTMSNPASPVASMPDMPQNAFLMLEDDVVAQSPKKGVATTMDNIDVPAEDDFQLEMNNCPHELEQLPEHTNGTANGDETIRSHSPASEPSYQELNLKEAMQCDEKLDNEYSDVQQNVDTIDNHPNELNILAKEQNPMSMSFYEGRDDALIISNSDELNKVQPLPSDDESSEQNNGPLVEEVAAPVENHTVEDTPIVQSEDHLVSFEAQVESEDASPHAEQLPESIFTAAAQVVDDVTTLVGQMDLEIPAAVETIVPHEVTANLFEFDDQLSKPIETETVPEAHETENLVSFEQDVDLEIQPAEATLDEIPVDLHIQLQPAELSQPLSAAETEELASPLVEVSQQEVTTDNEFITDENVLDVPSPIPTVNEAPISPTPIEQNEPVEELCVVEKEAAVEQVPEVVSNDVLADITATVDPVPARVEEEVKPVAEEMPAPTETTIDELIVPKSTTTEQIVSSAAKLAKAPATGTAKKTTAAAKPLTKPAAKPVPSAKTASVPAVKKAPTTTAPSATARTSTIGTKSPKVAAITRTSTTDKKPSLTTTEKKLVNGDAKTSLIQKRTIASTTASAVKSASATAATRTTASTTVKSTTARTPLPAKPAAPAKAPASARAPTTAKAPVSATPRPSSGPAKTGSATARTSTGLPATKPRATPAAASKSVGAASTTAVASSRTVTAIKRISSVQTASQKTATTTTTTSSTAAAAAKSSSTTTSRTSTVASKTSTTSAGMLRKPGTVPARKPISSPSAKTAGTKAAPVGGKPVPIKSNAVTSLRGTTTVSNDTKDLLDLDKQLKNDNNQLITKNGIETQMIVIDSAAD